MTTQSIAADHYATRAAITRAAVAAVRARWESAAGRAVDMAWERLLPEVMTIVAGVQLAAARTADDYVDSTLAQQGARTPAAGAVAANRLAGIASDGRTLDGLLRQPAVAAAQALKQGVAVERALAGGQASLEMIVRTQVADAGRVADGIAVTARNRVGYVRMLIPPSCSRCVLLAGRWYAYDAGFPRHPVCNCTQIPAREDAAGDLRTDPKDYFRSLPEQDQNRIFTKAGAQAIRDGADMGQVVNARRGMSVAGEVTTEGATSHGFAGQRLGAASGQVARRLTPEGIYKLAESRADAVRLLRRFGYIL